MGASIDYYFTLISPFSYLGHPTLLAVVEKHGATVNYKPFYLFDVWKTSGAVPVPERPASRQAYRLIELQRIAQFRNLPLTVRPKHWPTNPTLANGVVAALAKAGSDPSAFMMAAYGGCWARDEDIADETTIVAYLTDLGLDAAPVIAAAKSDATIEKIAANTEEAVSAGAVGAPVYVLDGEPFWGQDRIEYLDHALSTGRKRFTAD